jgi:hypothetical protein
MSATETWWAIATDPNHIVAEIIWNIVFDGLIIAVGYGILVKKLILPKIHKYIDDKHDIKHAESEY